MNLQFDNLVKNLHTLMLPSSLWGIHVDPKFQFIAALKMGLAGMERIFVEKAVLLTTDNDSLRILTYLYNELIYLPCLDCQIESISDYTKLLYTLHNEVEVCRKYLEGTNSPGCQKFALRSHNSEHCQICIQEEYLKTLSADNDCNNYDPHNLEDDEHIVNSVVHHSFDQSVACSDIHQPLNEISSELIESLQSSVLTCQECNAQFQTVDDLQQHVKVHSAPTGYVCETCNHISTELVMHRKHVATHNKRADTNLCNVCGKTFQKKYRLKDHMLIHSSEKPYKCEICGKMFSKEYNLKMHERVHSGERPFVCSKCGKTFTTSSNLSTHLMSAHENKRRHHCETCNMSFVHPRNLRIHIRKHTGEKPFECGTCGKSFAKKIHLTVHSRTHSGERPYACDVCEKRFTTTGNLNCHRKTHHKDDIT